MHEIKLYGAIGGMFGTSAEEFLAQIPKGSKDITVRIHSPGGSVGDGLAMHNALRDYSAGKVIAIVDGYAASSASFVMLAADEVHVHESSLVFLHKPWSVAEGNADDMRKSADDLDKHEEAISSIYMRKTGRSAEDIAQILNDETFLTGKEAVEMGFADVLIDDPEAEIEVAALLEFSTKLQGAIMSTQKTRKDIQSELDASIVEVEALKVSAKADIDEIKASIATFEATIAERDAEVVALKQVRDEAIADVESGKEIIADATAKVDELTEAAAKHDDQVKAFEMKLADPAYVDAAKVDAQVDVQVVADAEADAAEAQAQVEAEADAPKTIGEQYNKMEQGQARRDFWNDNRRAILNDVEKDNDNA
jgi:ATP-dependent Clp endopeptidase proteolytic subunit ClpP